MPTEAYLGYCKQNITTFLGEVKEVLFVPYAGVTFSYDDYAKSVADALSPLGIKVTGIHTVEDKQKAVAEAASIMVGGGNTFELLHQLYENGLVDLINEKVSKGTPYIGWSAGSNMACPTIKTTNDMPITMPKSFDALNLIPFQINPHYTEERIPNHGGETRPLRIEEFLTKNTDMAVLGLPEGCMLEIHGKSMKYIGGHAGKLFINAKENKTIDENSDLSYLLD